MQRLITSACLFLSSATVLAHHSVIGVYDDQRRVTIEVEVRTFELVSPHPLMFVEIIDIPDGQVLDGVTVGQTWTLEMDNVRELTALGFDDQTFVPGDQVRVAVDPSRHTRYRENTMYLRAAEHQREGFVYIHNVRELFPVGPAADNLSKHLHKVN